LHVDRDAAAALGAVLDRLREAADRRVGTRALAKGLAEVLSCDHVSLWTRASAGGAFLLGAIHPERPGHLGRKRQQLKLTPDELPDGDALASGRVVVAEPHLTVDGVSFAEALELPPLAELMLVPIGRTRRIEGVAACGVFDGTLTAAQRELGEQIAPHLAWTLETWRLQEALAQGRDRRHHFASLAADVLLASNVESTAVRLCELTRAIFGTTRSAFFLLEDRDLVPLAAAGPYGERAGGGSLHVPPGVEPIFDEALATGQVIVVNDFRASRYAATPIPLPFRPQAALVMPLIDTHGTLGMLTASELDDPLRFDVTAAEEARLLGAVATVAVRRVLLLEDLRRASRAKDDFLAAVSHELRTPLNVVLGYLQLLSERAFGALTDEQAETVGRAEKGAQSQLALVNDLLDLAAIERGSLNCELTTVRVADLVDELADIVRGLLAQRPITFSADVPDALAVYTDRERLKQVVINVLANAAKFTEKGEIRLSAYAAEGRTVVEVADTGSGMEAAFVARATEPFVRGDHQGTGSGLGLAIVSRVLRALGGSLSIDSRPGVGTTLRILLPREATDALEESAAS
jgi:signal transduction histidine kinase